MTLAPSEPLGTVADMIRGVTFRPDDLVPPAENTTVACFRTSNVQDEIDLSDVWYLPRSFARRPELLLHEGDILISTANSWNLVGKCAWVPRLPYDSVPGGFIAAVRANEDRVTARYLFHWLRLPHTQATLRSCANKTTNISNLSIERCLSLNLPLPSLDEQRQIAGILDQADGLRRKRRLALEKLNTLPRAIFQEMFGDPGPDSSETKETTLGEICAVKGGKRLPKGAAYADAPTAFRYIRVLDFANGSIDQDNLLYLTPEVQRNIARYTVRAGDVVISIAGSIGLVAEVPESLSGANLTENAAKLEPHNRQQISSTFLTWLLRSPFCQSQIAASTGQVTIGKLALFRIEKLRIPLPSLKQQNVFELRIAAVQDELAMMVRASKMVDALFASLQQRAFSGQLLPSHPDTVLAV